MTRMPGAVPSIENPLTAERIARESALWKDLTIAACAWRKAQDTPDAVRDLVTQDPMGVEND